MARAQFICAVLVLLLMATGARSPATAADVAELRASFASPPRSARPWVYWTWLGGNLTREGITADLEAMDRVGIGGALILDVDQGTPHGSVKFFDAQWRAMFKHAVAEAKRLGLELNVNNGAGYYGSGGGWVPPGRAMQTVVAGETHVTGGAKWTGVLPRPSKNAEYRDVAVIAVGEAGKPKYRIPDFTMKSLQWKSWIAYKGTRSAAPPATAPADAIVPMDRVVDIGANMAADGSLAWDAPPGEWTILRLGHAWNGSTVGPAPAGEGGPETDKLDKAATALHFDAFVRRLNEIAGPDATGTLVATHIDSWEGGGQNWTAPMRDEFRKRRGYDPARYLPVLTGRVLGSADTTERFLWDLRKTVSELMLENYSAEFQRLAHAAGLRNTFESYTTIGNDLDNANFADEPMAEFWTPNGQGADFQPTVKSMSSAAHLNRRPIVAAEAFTSGNREKWLWHPAMIKSIGDEAFCGGVNRFVFHRYASQHLAGRSPGVQMGPWGLHYERTNTWWEWTGPWHEYVSRCQYLLRQGEPVADVLKLESEEPLQRFQNLPLAGYDYDACGPDTFARATVRDGAILFPSGARYRLVVLPATPTMTVRLLTRVRDLVRDGACVLGDPPLQTPGLSDLPAADAELKKLAAEVWGDPAAETDRHVGNGRVFRGVPAERALTSLGLTPDFTSDAGLKWVHRADGGTDIYFVANTGPAATTAACTFRVAGRPPEIWDAETGRATAVPAYAATESTTRLSLSLAAAGSAFVVFRPDAAPAARTVGVTRDGEPIVTDGLAVATKPGAESAIDLATGDVRQPGTYVLTRSDGRTRDVVVASLPEPVTLAGPWKVRFPAGSGAPPDVTLDGLASWSEHANPGVKYFSGTATYAKTIMLPPVAPDSRLTLDLGRVAVMARVTLNGKDLGVLWKPPYRVDVTAAAKPGENVLEVAVVNLWVNRLIGDEQLPEDSDRNKDGTLKAWPQWLLDGKPSPTGRLTFSSWRLWKKGDALQESGLLGPVVFRTTQGIRPP